jgi:hypothetical protein
MKPPVRWTGLPGNESSFILCPFLPAAVGRAPAYSAMVRAGYLPVEIPQFVIPQ